MKENVFLMIADAALHLGILPQTLLKWREEGKGPRYTYQLGFVYGYMLHDLEKYTDKHLIEPEYSSRQHMEYKSSPEGIFICDSNDFRTVSNKVATDIIKGRNTETVQ